MIDIHLNIDHHPHFASQGRLCKLFIFIENNQFFGLDGKGVHRFLRKTEFEEIFIQREEKQRSLT